MKSLLLWAAALLFSTQVDADGVCYDPDHTPGKSAGSVAKDMNLIKSHGFDHVRTYISKFGDVNMGQVIAQAGLNVALGVPFPAGDTEAQAQAAIDAAKTGRVVYIFVGNENLASTGSVPQAQFDLIARIKSQVPGNVKVGTVQRNTEFLARSVDRWDELVAACDVVGANVHPFFNPGTSAEGAITVLNTQWNQIRTKYGGKAILTETGWPSAGSSAGNTGSLVGQQAFFNTYKSWSASIGNSDKYFFQFFNQDQRSDGLHEQTFGLVTSDGQDKFAGIGGNSPQTPAPTTAPTTTQPPTTPPPTTAAPTTAAVTKSPQAQNDVLGHPVFSNKNSSVSSSNDGSHSTEGLLGNPINSESSSATDNSAKTEAGKLAATDDTKATKIGKATNDKNANNDVASPAQKVTTKSDGGASGVAVTLIIAAAFVACLFGIGFVFALRRKAMRQEELLLDEKEDFMECETPARWSRSPKAV